MNDNQNNEMLNEDDELWPSLNDLKNGVYENDNEIDKQIWDDTFRLLSTYGHKWAEINALTHVWFYMNYGIEYGEQYDQSINLPKMYNAAPMYFSLSRIAIERTSRIELAKLFEGSDSASIKYLREHIEKNAELICYTHRNIKNLRIRNEELKKCLSKHIDSIKALKEIRHKHLAHNDPEYFLKVGYVRL